MPIVMRVAIKPTPSIARQQDTVSLRTMQHEKLIIEGRHDPCIVHRAVPCIESVMAIAILDKIV
jgi:chorismate synthase